MAELNVEIKGRLLSLSAHAPVPAGMQNVDSVKFTYDDEWNGYGQKYLVVKSRYGTGETALDSSGSAKLPAWALEHAGHIWIGLKGVNSTSKAVLTSTMLILKVDEGASLGDLVFPSDQKTIHDLLAEIKESGISGTPGTPTEGPAGRGVTKITRYYSRTATSTKPTSTSSFSTTYTAPTSSNKYSWAYDSISYTDGTSENTEIFMLGAYLPGSQGPKGESGKGITGITRYYSRTSSSTKPTSTTGFSTSYTATTTTYRYLWAYDEYTYTDGTKETTEIFQLGVRGATGSQGTKGESGKGISSTKAEYALSADANTTPGLAVWESTPQTPTATQTASWVRVTITYTDNTTAVVGPYLGGMYVVGEGGTGDSCDCPTWAYTQAHPTDADFKMQKGLLYYYGTVADGTSFTLDASGAGTEWRWVFDTGATAPTLTFPIDVRLPAGFEVKANKHYEISVINDMVQGCSYAIPGEWDL